MSRRTAPARRWATRSRCGALAAVLGAGRTARRAAAGRLRQDQYRPPGGGGRRRRASSRWCWRCEHGSIPPHLHFQHPSPHIPWDGATNEGYRPRRTPGRKGPRARIAGVSSFGFSGTNAHAIIAGGAASRGKNAPTELRTFIACPVGAQRDRACDACFSICASHVEQAGPVVSGRRPYSRRGSVALPVSPRGRGDTLSDGGRCAPWPSPQAARIPPCTAGTAAPGQPRKSFSYFRAGSSSLSRYGQGAFTTRRAPFGTPSISATASSGRTLPGGR